MSTLAQQWLEQGRQEGRLEGRQQWLQQGRQEGIQQAVRQNILELLDIRLGAVPAAIAGRLENVETPETLRLLLRRAATVDTLAEFEQALETILGMKG